MSERVNKHGLPRHIPLDVQAQIRKDDGYGCIKCGNIFIQYEHIDPLYCDATEHNSENMTLLCSGCHSESTGKRLPKRLIQNLKKDPYCKRVGFAKGNKFYPNPDQMLIEIGNSTFSNTDIAITIHGKPIIWVTKDDSDPYSPLLYNAIFMDSNGNKIGFLNKNQFIGLVNGCDFQAISSRIEVRSQKGEINLVLDIKGDSIVKIKRIFFKYGMVGIKLNTDGSIQAGDNFRVSGIHTENCFGGLSIGGIPRHPNRLTMLYNSILFSKSQRVFDIFEKHSGFMFKNEIFDLEFGLVGFVKNHEVYNLFEEYIGNLLIVNESQVYVVMDKEEYPNQEPIWISSRNKRQILFQSAKLIDTSYRLFGL
ncbi:HNH endonuclease [Acinetobacter albensis]|uniref:HNH endonuclease n=1 Tax=Acinetobacter albensis TaxID=1673609 RepID=A0ABW9JTU1_9GAMM